MLGPGRAFGSVQDLDAEPAHRVIDRGPGLFLPFGLGLLIAAERTEPELLAADRLAKAGVAIAASDHPEILRRLILLRLDAEACVGVVHRAPGQLLPLGLGILMGV